jgi:TonB family protein
MKVVWACLLIPVAVLALSQTVPKPAEEAHPHLSIADFGLVYPLSNDWVQATQMTRKRVESAEPPQDADVLLAAVYVLKSNLSATSTFFSLLAYRQPATDCKKNLEAMIAHSQDKKDKNYRIEGNVVEFSAAGRVYFRVNMAHGLGGRHQCMICTTANGHLLVWNAGASNEKGLDAIVDTLNSITPLSQRSATVSAQSAGQKDGKAEGAPSKPDAAQPDRVKASSGVASGLLIKKVTPVYPDDARAAYIQGTVTLLAKISKTGDITDLELLDGPIELAGSAVAAVRQWKYRPYLLMGQPVAVQTEIRVNYELRP